jgi:hypothetical protein
MTTLALKPVLGAAIDSNATLIGASASIMMMQVSLWALLYWWQIGWDFNTALYFSTVTCATIG